MRDLARSVPCLLSPRNAAKTWVGRSPDMLGTMAASASESCLIGQWAALRNIVDASDDLCSTCCPRETARQKERERDRERGEQNKQVREEREDRG